MRARLGLALATALIVAACGGGANTAVSPTTAPSGSAAPTSPAVAKVRASYGNITPTNLPAFFAKETGIFQANFLDVDLQLIEGGSKSMAALLGNQVDIAGLGGTEAMSAFVGGGDIAALALFAPVSTWTFMVPPSYRGPQDLKGKSLGIVTKGGSAHVALNDALKRLGVDPKDVTIAEIGSVPNLATAMIAGAVYAGPSHPPESSVLTKAGFKVVVDLAKEKVPATDNALIVGKTYLRANTAVVQRYVDSLIQALAKARNDKPAAVAVLKKMLNLTDEQSLSETYDFYFGGVFPVYPHPDLAAFESSRVQLIQTNPKVADLDPKRLIDDSFVADAEKRGVAGK